MLIYLIIVTLIVLLAIVVGVSLKHVEAPTSEAWIISGLGKSKTLLGSGGWIVRWLQRIDKLNLSVISMDTRAGGTTKDYIGVNVDTSAKVKVAVDKLDTAAKNFLNVDIVEVRSAALGIIKGAVNDSIGKHDIFEIASQRETLVQAVEETVKKKLGELGLVLVSFDITSLSDNSGVIESLATENAAKITKKAKLDEIETRHEIAMVQETKHRELNELQISNNLVTCEKQNQLDLKQSEWKEKSETARAKADNAYQIQQQELQKTLNQKTVDAQIELTKRQQQLSQEKIKVKENELEVNVKKPAEAEAYRQKTLETTNLETQKLRLEASRLSEEQRLEFEKKAQELVIEQEKSKGELKAQQIEAEGKAKAEATKAKLMAEAEGRCAIIDLYSKIDENAMKPYVVDKLPEINKSIVSGLNKVGKVNIYSTDGKGVDSVTGQVPVMMQQTMDLVESMTGVSVGQVIKKDHGITGDDTGKNDKKKK